MVYGESNGKFGGGGEDELRAGLRVFLEADAADDAAGAEAALAALFAGLPPIAPGADFAGRLMARIAAAPGRLPRHFARGPRDLPRAFRWPLAAALAASGIASYFLLPGAILFLSRMGPGEVLKATAGMWAALGQKLASLAWVYQLGHQLLKALFEVAGSPPVLLAIVAAAALATLISRWLWVLLEPSRRTSDAF